MKSKEISVDFKIGIHSRPAALLVKKVKEFPLCKISFMHGEKTAQGNSLIGLLSLGVVEGSVLTVCVEGQDEEKVLSEIEDYFKTKVSMEG